MGEWTETENELDALRKSVNRGSPYGSEDWMMRIANRLQLEFTLHRRVRPGIEERQSSEKVRVLHSVDNEIRIRPKRNMKRLPDPFTHFLFGNRIRRRDFGSV